MEGMAARPSDDEIDMLLGEGRVTAPAQERIFDRALRDAGVGAAPPRRRGFRFSFAAGLSLALGAAAVMIVPRLAHRQDAGFRAKGAASLGAGPELDVSCIADGAAAALAACPAGARLVFSVSGNTAGGYLAAYAEPRAGGERIWYFSAEGQSPPLPTATGTVALGQAIRLGPEHAPGDYRISLYVTRVPLPRAALLAGSRPDAVLASREVALRVVEAAR
jgi:hypothetical protein